MSKTKSNDDSHVNAIVSLAGKLNEVVKGLSPQVNAFFDGLFKSPAGRKPDPLDPEYEAGRIEREIQAEQRKQKSEEIESLGKYEHLAKLKKKRDEIPRPQRPARF